VLKIGFVRDLTGLLRRPVTDEAAHEGRAPTNNRTLMAPSPRELSFAPAAQMTEGGRRTNGNSIQSRRGDSRIARPFGRDCTNGRIVMRPYGDGTSLLPPPPFVRCRIAPVGAIHESPAQTATTAQTGDHRSPLRRWCVPLPPPPFVRCRIAPVGAIHESPAQTATTAQTGDHRSPLRRCPPQKNRRAPLWRCAPFLFLFKSSRSRGSRRSARAARTGNTA